MHTQLHQIVSRRLNHLNAQASGHDGAWCHVQNLIQLLHALGRLPAPANKMPSPPFRRWLPRVCGGCVLSLLCEYRINP